MPSTQYDAISRSYATFKGLPVFVMEIANARALLTPLINSVNQTHPCRILDLASGLGAYTRHLIDWGAHSVHGLDISPVMVEGARQTTHEAGYTTSQIQYSVADCADLVSVSAALKGSDQQDPQQQQQDPQQFDIVFAAWLTNYASTAAELTSMFRVISTHLSPHGVFAAVVPAPSHDPHTTFEQGTRVWRAYGSPCTPRDPTPDGSGVKCHVYGLLTDPRIAEGLRASGAVRDTAAAAARGQGKDVEFDCYLLRKEIYEQCARAGGLSGKLSWVRPQYPREPSEAILGWERWSGEGRGFWDPLFRSEGDGKGRGEESGFPWGLLVIER